MAWPTSDELGDLVARFRARTLRKDEWTHRAHLAVGTWHVREHGPDQALELLRHGITRLNEAHGTVNGDDSGYHETVTRAYVRLLADFIGTHAGLAVADCVQELLVSPLAGKTALLRYYSKDCCPSPRGKDGWSPTSSRFACSLDPAARTSEPPPSPSPWPPPPTSRRLPA